MQSTGAVFIHPYNDPRVIAGQGTMALELLQQVTLPPLPAFNPRNIVDETRGGEYAIMIFQVCENCQSVIASYAMVMSCLFYMFLSRQFFLAAECSFNCLRYFGVLALSRSQNSKNLFDVCF
jgi:hypothetical protein